MSGIIRIPKATIHAFLMHAKSDLERARAILPIPGDKDAIDRVIEKIDTLAAGVKMLGDGNHEQH